MNRVQRWNKIRAKLKELFYSLGITRCEKCGSGYNLSFAHRHNRAWYYRRDKSEEEKLLGDFRQVLLLCGECHAELDDRSKTTEEEKEELFNKHREAL